MYYYPQQQQQSQYAAGMNYMQPQIQNIGLKGRPVSSIEEVRAAQIDFDGSLFIFPDIANQRIYTKQINLDGTASLKSYIIEQPQVKVVEEYVTKEEFEKVILELKQTLNKEERKGVKQNEPINSF